MSPCTTPPLRLFLILFLLSIAQTGFSQFNLTDTLPADPDLLTGTLPNGLRYYIRSNQRSVKNVQLRLVVNAGSVLEEDDQQGLAHFMEHMNFNGLRHFPRNGLMKYLESIGGKIGADLNAFTSFDETSYVLWLTTEEEKGLDKGFTILEDWSHNALLDTVEINKERGIVLEESRMHKDAGDRMRSIYMPLLSNGSKYAERLPIGKDSIIASFRPESLRRFYADWYRPDLMAVIVVGNIDPLFAEKEIRKHFGGYGNPPNERPRPSVIPISPRKNDEAVIVTDKEYQTTMLGLVSSIGKKPVIHTWADYRASILEDLFNSMVNTRLYALTQQADPPFLSGSASFADLYRGYRMFNANVIIGEKPVKPAIEALEGVLESIRQFGFLDGELGRAKSILSSQAERVFLDINKTETAQFAQKYSNNFLTGWPIISITDWHSFITQLLPVITLEEVNAVAKKMESGQGKFALLMAPEKNKAQLPSGPALLDLVAAAEKQPVAAYRENAVGNTLLDKLPVPGKVTAKKRDWTLGTTELELSNGITVTLKPTDFKNDDVQMDAWRPGGSRNYGLSDKQNAQQAARIVQAMGVKNFSKTDLDRFLSGKKVSVQPYINTYEEGIQGKCSPDDFGAFIQLLYLYFTEPRKDEDLFKSYVNRQKEFSRNLLSNPANFYADTIAKIVYKNNPWLTNAASGTVYDRINLDRALTIYKEVFSNAYGLHFTFVGTFDVERIIPVLEQYLGSLPASPKENRFRDEGMRPVKGVVEATVVKGQAKQSQVNLIFTGETPYDLQEELKLQVLTEVLNIKIFEQLREEMSGIYSASMTASFNRRPYEHYSINIRFPCGPGNVGKLTDALFDIIRNAQENGIEKSYLSKVKEMMAKHHAGLYRVNDYWLQSLSHSWIDQTDPAWINKYYTNIEAITPRELKQTAIRYFDRNNFIKVILQPE
jgi:zinc protease